MEPRGGGNWGNRRIPREDWGSLGESPPHLKNPIIEIVPYPPSYAGGTFEPTILPNFPRWDMLIPSVGP